MSSDEHVEQTKQQIRALVAEIAQIAKSDFGPEEFYPAFLDRIVQALAAVGGAIWMLGESQEPELKYQINVSQPLLEEETEESRKHHKLLRQVMAGNEGHLILPQSGTSEDGSAGNPTSLLLVLAPVIADSKCIR